MATVLNIIEKTEQNTLNIIVKDAPEVNVVEVSESPNINVIVSGGIIQSQATFQEVTDNGNTTTNNIVVQGEVLADSVQLSGGTGDQGTMSWNTDEETIDIIQNGATLQVGQEIHIHCKNQTGSDIADGVPVYVTGTLGSSGRLTIAPMIADNSIDAKFYIGITTESIPNGEDGKVTTFGKVRGLDTSSYSEGATLYVSETTAGTLVTTRPTAPNLDLETAIVINSHENNGTIFVRANQGHYITQNHDVYVNSITDGQVLSWNAANQRFENSDVEGGLWTEGTGGDIYYTGGDVGIGTTTPSSKLEVKSSDNVANTKIISAYSLSETQSTSLGYNSVIGSYSLALKTLTTQPIRLSPNDTEVMRIDASGNVGIGTTSPSSKLHIYSTNAVSDGYAVSTTSGGETAKFTPRVLDFSTPNTPQIKGIGLQFKLSGNSSLSAGNAFSYLPNDTRQSLGDTDAEQAWINIEPLIEQTSTANYVGLLMDVTETSTGSGDNKLIDLRVGGTSKFNIDNGGQISIQDGTATNPAITFYSENGTPNTGIFREAENKVGISAGGIKHLFTELTYEFGASGPYIRSSGFTASTPMYSFGSYTTTGMFRPIGLNEVAFTTSGTERMRITSTGVGIGTTSPSVKLHVVGNELRFDAATTADMNLYVSAGVNRHFNFYNIRQDSDFVFKQNVGGVLGTETLIIKGNTGNVGIGTTSPSTELHVVGNMTLDDGNTNISIGDSSTLSSVTTGTLNTGIGTEVLSSVTTGGFNVGIGKQALYSVTGQNYNVGIGHLALRNAITSDNIAIGGLSLYNTTTGSENLAIGSSSLRSNTTGQHNVAIGHQALYDNTTGGTNVAIGRGALRFSDSYYNIAIGRDSLYSATTGTPNTAIGWRSLYNLTTGIRNTALGYRALETLTTANSNIAIGYNALFANTGASNVSVGTQALEANTTGASNVAVGGYAMNANTTASDNIAIGSNALDTNTTGIRNVAIGSSALTANTTGTNNIGIGFRALYLNTYVGNNIGIGLQALYNTTTGGDNIAIGSIAVINNTTGVRNTGIGYGALGNNTTGGYNTGLGYLSLYDLSSGSNNMAFGYIAGRYIADGTTSLTTSNNSIFLGNQTKASANSITNEIVIGHDATGNGSNTVTLGNDSITDTYLKGDVTIEDSNFIYLGSSASTRIEANVSQIRGYYASETSQRFDLGRDTWDGGGRAGLLLGGAGGYAGIGTDGTSGNSLLFGAAINAVGNGDAYEKMRLTSSGRLGINITSPSEKLHVDGNIRVGGGTTTATKLYVVGTGNRGGYLQARADGNGSTGIDFNLEGTTGGSFRFGSDILPISYFNQNLGNSSTPFGSVFVQNVKGRNNTAEGTLNISSGTTSNPLTFQIGGTEYARLHNNGNFGIGTTSPAQDLVVNSTTNNGGITLQRDGVDAVKISRGGTPSIQILNTSGQVRTVLSSTGRSYFREPDGLAIGSDQVDASAILDIVTTTKGVLLPRLTTTQVSAISSPATGLTVYNTTLNQLCFYNGTEWRKVSDSTM